MKDKDFQSKMSSMLRRIDEWEDSNQELALLYKDILYDIYISVLKRR